MAFTIVAGGGQQNFVTATGGGNTDNIVVQLLGGRYAWGASATFGGGNVALQILMPDGTTYIAASAALTAAGTQIVDLCAGTYKILVTTATATQVFLCPVPYRPSP